MKKISNFVAVLVTALFVPQLAFAQGGGLAGLGGFMPLILIFAFFYLFLLRPQQKKAKEHQKLLNNLKKDDKVITSGGIYAAVVSVRENIVEVRIAEGVNVQVAKQSITAVISREEVKTPEIVK